MKWKKNALLWFTAGIVSAIAINLLIASGKIDRTTPVVTVSNDGRPQYKWFAPMLPSSLDFAGEIVPLDKQDVQERLKRELISNSYQQSNTLNILLLTARYFPAIEERLKANGIPDDFKYLCIAESSLHQNALSGAGAASFWQFMKETGPHYGLEVNDEVDERFNVIKATDAACKYFTEAHNRFGTWTAAAASYNCGQAGYFNQVDFQGSSNYYDLIFPDETNRYIFRILALKLIIGNPKQYGFMMDEAEEFQPLKFRTVTVDKSIEDLANWAKANNSSYKMLKIYNPWLRAHKLTVKAGKHYDIQLPL